VDTSLLTEHPYFDKILGKHFWFKKDDISYNIYFNEESNFRYPVIWHSSDVAYSIWECPLWFKEIYNLAHEVYFKKDRIRYLSGHFKKPLRTLLFMSTFFEENGEQLYDDLRYLYETGFTCFKKEELPFFEKLVKELEKEHYALVIQKLESGDYMIKQ
jgi:hypothetical protein